MMRLALALVVIASPALAQPAPGTGGDPIRGLMVDPAVVNAELPVLAIHGGNPDDTVVLFDGFELPWVFHANAVRSVAPPGSVEIDLMPSGFGVEYGRGSSIVSLSSSYGDHSTSVELTPIDVLAHAGQRGLSASAALGWNGLLREVRDVETDWFAGAIARSQHPITSRSKLVLSAIYADDQTRWLVRPVAAFHYKSEAWYAVLAASYMRQHEVAVDRFAIDTRAEALRSADQVAGLTKFQWRIGQQTNSNRYAFTGDTLWRHDVAGWTSLAGNLSPRIRATAGLRVDDFDGDAATQPRAALIGQPHRRLIVALAAGAYRRPPEQLDEVRHDLGPERATHVAAGALFDDKRGLRLNAVAYFIDRRRLVVRRDGVGELANTGSGTSLGIDLLGEYRDGPWLAKVSTALTRSKRFDYLRAAERPSEYEQPFRFDVIGGWRKARMFVSARLQLASGLPFTPYTGATYDSDTDTYEPLYVPPLSDRAPFHHQIDLRVDYRVIYRRRFALDAYLDLHNAYRNRDAIAYRYSYDYSERTAITALPLYPFAGLRAQL
jgi:hypothetical protein